MTLVKLTTTKNRKRTSNTQHENRKLCSARGGRLAEKERVETTCDRRDVMRALL